MYANTCRGDGRRPALGINDRILLAKSLQGDKSELYYVLWLSKRGPISCFCPVWCHDASRFSRKGSAPANSPAVSVAFSEHLAAAHNGRFRTAVRPSRKRASGYATAAFRRPDLT